LTQRRLDDSVDHSRLDTIFILALGFIVAGVVATSKADAFA
jgi:hypothetical protein